jgi:hypothetical protein
MSDSRTRVVGVSSFALLVISIAYSGQPPSAQGLPETLPAAATIASRISCGTSALRDLLGIRPQAVIGIADGESLSYEQDPPVVFNDYTGPITLRNFSIVGDYPSVQFRRTNYDAPDNVTVETWNRVNSRSVDGRVISVFEPSWPDDQLRSVRQRSTTGYDDPDVYIGALEMPGRSELRWIDLRVGLHGINRSEVIQINDHVQYASNVANLVIPGWGDTRISGGTHEYPFTDAAKIFYQYFADAYDVIAFTDASTVTSDYGAFQRNTRNPVSGLNITVFDQSRTYGSSGALQGVEHYTNAARAVAYEDTNHEMAHQWGSNFNWTRIAGIARAGHQPTAHSPLWTGGETLIGAVLFGNRRVRTTADGFSIERTPAPIHYHPIELYSMGQLASGDVPDFLVFNEQGQFNADNVSTPDVGTAVIGQTTRVSMADVIRIHGTREGPVPTQWRRATVLVSRDHLATQEEMDYWNFFAQRLADRHERGMPTGTGFATFRLATKNAISLSTLIEPLQQSALPQSLETDQPAFGPTDWRDVRFAGPVSTRFGVGDMVTLIGRVTATDAVDFNAITAVFYQHNGGDPVRFNGEVRRSGDFAINVRFTDSQRGQYDIGMVLFWPNSGPQYARTYLSGVTVE